LEEHPVTKPRLYYANQLLGTQRQQQAADRLLGLLTLKQVLNGVRTSFLAFKWGRAGSAVYGLSNRARGMVYQRSQKVQDLYAEYALDAALLPVQIIRENFAKYGAVIDQVEAELVRDLNDKRVEALIRQMFNDEPEAVYCSHRSPDRKRAAFEAGVKRGPGRPAGSKNKPKEPPRPESEAWPMPDGFSFSPTRPKAVIDALNKAVDPESEWS
jgi:hypothetical protein